MKSVLKIFSMLLVSALAFSCGEKADPTDDKPMHETPSTPSEPETPSTPIQVKIVSFNVKYPDSKDTNERAWSYRFTGVSAMIQEVDPDIIGTQECYISQREEIIAAFPKYKAYGVRRSDGVEQAGDSETTSILYNSEKFEIVDKGTFWLSRTPDQPSAGWDATTNRTTTWILFKEKSTEKMFYVYNTHLDHQGVEAQKEGAKLI